MLRLDDTAVRVNDAFRVTKHPTSAPPLPWAPGAWAIAFTCALLHAGTRIQRLQ